MELTRCWPSQTVYSEWGIIMSDSTAGKMTSRARLQATLAHTQPDRVCVDFGSTFVTGIHASAVARLRQQVLADAPDRVKVIEPYQMLGEIDDALRAALGIDVVGVPPRTTMFGFELGGWKPFTMNDGTEVLVEGTAPLDPADDSPDSDGDGISDVFDNCQNHPNPSQTDSNGVGFVNRCDSDLNNH